MPVISNVRRRKEDEYASYRRCCAFLRSPKTNFNPQEEMIRFNVFGTLVGVEWKNNEWKPYYLGNEGKRRDADFIIPTETAEEEIAHYLAVLFHEEATPERNEVKRIG